LISRLHKYAIFGIFMFSKEEMDLVEERLRRAGREYKEKFGGD
jgi:hypothetical protein